MAATRDLDRGRVRPDAVDRAYAADLADFVQLQRDAGLDFFSDGLLRWQDIFRPLVEASPAMRPGALVRWFDNNAFFRVPELRQPISHTPVPASIIPDGQVPRPRVATLPSPYMFSRAAAGGSGRNQLMIDLAKHVLRPAAQGLVAAGCRVIHLQDPWLAYYGIDVADWKPLEQALAAVKEGLSATVVLQVYFGSAGPIADRLRRLPVDAIGVDLVETEVDALGTRWEIGLVLGCLNGRSSIVEPVEDLVELANRIVDTVHPPSLYLSSNSDLEFLARTVAERKVRCLGEAALRMKELVAR